MSALTKWLTRWQPIAIHCAVLAGARMEAIAGALGNSLQVAFERWNERPSRQRDFVVNGKSGTLDNCSAKCPDLREPCLDRHRADARTEQRLDARVTPGTARTVIGGRSL
jgi:hypothetical protein